MGTSEIIDSNDSQGHSCSNAALFTMTLVFYCCLYLVLIAHELHLRYPLVAITLAQWEKCKLLHCVHTAQDLSFTT